VANLKLTYCTAIWTHHQEGVCRELHKRLGDAFKMVLTLPLDHPLSIERTKMGWNLIPPDEDWIVGPPKTAEEANAIDYRPYILDAEVTVLGWVPYVRMGIIRARTQSGKLTFFQNERFFKKERQWRDYITPRVVRNWLSWWYLLHRKNVHYLAISYWCKDDLAFLHACKNRTWQWAYLTPVSDTKPVKPANGLVEIGWCGRMLKWKCVDYILQAVKLLPEECRNLCHVTLIGNGEMEVSLKCLADSCKLADVVTFKDSVSAKDAVAFMRGLDVYIMPSNHEEGWGAALPEAMSEGCAVIANTAAGATLAVIKPGENGFVFDDGDIVGLAKHLENLIRDAGLRHRLGSNAWSSMQMWAPSVGAERLLTLIDCIQTRHEVPYTHGLCSRLR